MRVINRESLYDFFSINELLAREKLQGLEKQEQEQECDGVLKEEILSVRCRLYNIRTAWLEQTFAPVH